MRVDTGRLRVVAHDVVEAEALTPSQLDDAVATGAAARDDGLPSPGAHIESQRLRRGMSIEQLAVVTKIPARSIRLLEADRFDELPGQVFVKGFLRCCARSLGVSQQAVMDLLYERERAALLQRRKDRAADRSGGRSGQRTADGGVRHGAVAPARAYLGEDQDDHVVGVEPSEYDDALTGGNEGDEEGSGDDGLEAGADGTSACRGPDDDRVDDVLAPAASSPEALRAATRARRQQDAAQPVDAPTRRPKRGRADRTHVTSRAARVPRTAPANEVGPRNRPPRGRATAAPRAMGLDAIERLRALLPSTHALLWIVVAIFVAFLVLAAFNLAGTPVGMPQS